MRGITKTRANVGKLAISAMTPAVLSPSGLSPLIMRYNLGDLWLAKALIQTRIHDGAKLKIIDVFIASCAENSLRPPAEATLSNRVGVATTPSGIR